MDVQLTRDVQSDDPQRVEALVASTGFFSPQETAIARELVETRLEQGLASGYAFAWARQGSELIGYACWGEIPCTEGRYDLYWIAVAQTCQRHGLGRRLLRFAEQEVRRAGGVRMYVDTSDRAQYASTRAFYERAGYSVAASLPDFYRDGDGKVIFVRELNVTANERA